MHTSTGPSEQFRAEHYAAALHKRSIRPAQSPYDDFTQIFIVSDGQAEAAYSGETHRMPRQSVFVFPPSLNPVLTLAAGTDAYLVGVSQALLIDVIGNKAESVLLRIFAERPALRTADDGVLFDQIIPLAKGFLNEARRTGNGSQMAIAAYMRLVLMAVWRSGDWEAPVTTGHGLDVAVLQRFRQLVELHFRDRKPVSFFADQLDLSHDRLHAICTRTLGRTPKELLQQRTIQEINLRLEKSGSSIQEIAHQLGFTDQTYFSHFYKKATGQPPQQYRLLSRQNGNLRVEAKQAEYADWP